MVYRHLNVTGSSSTVSQEISTRINKEPSHLEIISGAYLPMNSDVTSKFVVLKVSQNTPLQLIQSIKENNLDECRDIPDLKSTKFQVFLEECHNGVRLGLIDSIISKYDASNASVWLSVDMCCSVLESWESIDIEQIAIRVEDLIFSRPIVLNKMRDVNLNYSVEEVLDKCKYIMDLKTSSILQPEWDSIRLSLVENLRELSLNKLWLSWAKLSLS